MKPKYFLTSSVTVHNDSKAKKAIREITTSKKALYQAFVTSTTLFLLRPGRGAEYCDQFVCLCVCLSASISLESLDRSSRNLLCRSPVGVDRSSSGGVAICYVLPVLWQYCEFFWKFSHLFSSGILRFDEVTATSLMVPDEERSKTFWWTN